VEAYAELFDRMDLDNDGVLNKNDLDQYMMQTKGAPLQKATFDWLLREFEHKEGWYHLSRTLLWSCGAE
jgi:Ca2+-binding EF-hand superfamily protein